MKIFFLRTLTAALFFYAASTVAYAQEENTENQLEVFDSSVISEQEGIFVQDETVEEEDTTNNNNSRPLSEDPCPQPRAAYSDTPNDLKSIQEDITRFSLCVQRAQLLERLNSLTLENENTINSALDVRIDNIASEFTPEFPEMRDVPPPALPEDMPLAPREVEASPAPAPSFQSSWSINDITGNTGVLKAKLINEQDNIIHVEKGDTLPDGVTKVINLTPTVVEISRNNQTTQLQWE